ncbi:hypothetical protein [Desulfotignum phosphitoxidans]|uniref:Putative pyruvate formate lyase activating protein PflX n=1 Tax=Desulfotignum phosphitoxidans DSM 13687 TaxID=1286635 RepID=S0G7E0_9BACT|nr:hypothetical protein [Desulfotignum phosphitoxidans]EMS80806.1 putative pyruvate formate lyase activating protein PflX [Desulfotignum phosphitoxidans DSM 13687]
MKRITIGNYETTELKTFGYVYLSSFGALWLFIEPLGAFSIAPKYLSNLGLIGYLGLFVVAFILSIFLCRIWENLIFFKQDLITLKIESSLEGVNYLVKAPANMLIFDFSHLFIDRLEKGKASKKVKLLRRGNSPVLNMKRDGEKIELDDNITLKEANLLESDVFFITGRPIKPDNTPRFQVSSDFK